jgi:hypothetical protein
MSAGRLSTTLTFRAGQSNALSIYLALTGSLLLGVYCWLQERGDQFRLGVVPGKGEIEAHFPFLYMSLSEF